MFESILVRPNIQFGVDADIGLLAEALLFYKRTVVPANRGYLASLIRSVGLDDLLGLIEDDHIDLAIVEDDFVTITNTDSSGIIEYHHFAAMEVSGNQKKTRMSREERLTEIIYRVIDDTRAAKKSARRILEKSAHYKMETLLGKGREVTRLARSDMANESYMTEAAKTVLEHYVPNYMKSIRLEFRVIQTKMGFVVLHNLDFKKVNHELHQKISKETTSLTPALILNHIINACGEMALSSFYLSELVTTPLNHSLLSLQFKHLLLKRERSAEEIHSFQDIFLKGHAIREAINSGERSISDFRKLLDHAKKFKNWVDGVRPEARLIAEYHESSISGTWVDSLPIKTIRFAICTGLGLSDSPTGILASVVDSFLLDKIFKGWRPHHFVQGELTKFVDSGI
jgi:hypothetical protein